MPYNHQRNHYPRTKGPTGKALKRLMDRNAKTTSEKYRIIKK